MDGSMNNRFYYFEENGKILRFTCVDWDNNLYLAKLKANLDKQVVTETTKKIKYNSYKQIPLFLNEKTMEVIRKVENNN
jgi:hypothetical protein